MEEARLHAVIVALVSFGFVALWVKLFGLAEEGEPWIPWQWWHEINWRYRWGIFGAANVLLFLVLSDLRVWPRPQDIELLGPMGEEVLSTLFFGFLFSFALIDAAAIFVVGYATLLWLSEASRALREKREKS